VTISSRTPEGSPNDCPVCGAVVRIEPSRPPGDAPCPQCGTLLWFVPTDRAAMLFDVESVDALRERIAEIISARLGVLKERVSDSSSFVEDIGADSLDIVELVMGLEQDFGVTIRDEDAAELRTIDDVLNYILRRRSE
jgi:acyl carrier protein